jgi:hypothetical protein
MSQNPDPQRQPYPQQQPQYPQQYPPQYYGPPYYPPYQPPKSDDKKIVKIVIIVVIVVLVLPTVLAAILYFMVIGLAPSGISVPTGVWGTVIIVSSTAVNIDFGRINPEPNPMDIDIVLVRNGTTQGMYRFGSPFDGVLSFSVGSGIDIADISYSDLADNQRVNVGDQLQLTRLNPNSDYRIMMIWGPTGDQISSRNFSTPP